jgi:hypothetical protein
MTIPGSVSRREHDNSIEIKLQEFEQLFNTIDPSPFHEKDLDHDLEEFTVSWTKEYPVCALIDDVSQFNLSLGRQLRRLPRVEV